MDRQVIIGLTGGIGSGKSVIAQAMHRLFGYTVIHSDALAKELIVFDKDVRHRVETLLGKDVYDGNTYLTHLAAQRIFSSASILAQMNAIVHPAVAAAIVNSRAAKGIDRMPLIAESALLFQTPSLLQICDKTVAVTAPVNIRTERAMKRDNASIEEIETRMKNQMSDDDMAQKADIVVNNDGSISPDALARILDSQLHFPTNSL